MHLTRSELAKLLAHYGFDKTMKGKPAGSRRVFVRVETGQIIRLPKPHAGSILEQCQLKEILELLDLSK